MSPKEAPATHGWAVCQGWQSEKCAGNKRRVFAYRFFSTTSWVSQMTPHPAFCSYPLFSSGVGVEDAVSFKIYPQIRHICMFIYNRDLFFRAMKNYF